MVLESAAMISVGEAARNFKNIIDTVLEYRVAHIMNYLTPMCYFVDAEVVSNVELPNAIPSVTSTEANQKFSMLLKRVKEYGIVQITKRGNVSYYVIDSDFMRNYVSESDTVFGQINEFFINFIRQYYQTMDLVKRTEEELGND